jgi:diacylglycerol O-acyltransferase
VHTVVDPLEAHVRETDAFTFRMERDPLLRSTITAVAVFDRSPDWDLLVDRVERATRLAPSFRERLVSSPFGLAPPRWVLDPDFDLSWHLQRVDAPVPHTLETVLDMARVAGMTAFDPARPLWSFTLVEGLDAGRAALVMKVHHALTDGIGGIQLAAHVVDLERTPGDLGPMPPPPTAAVHGLGDRVAEAIGFDVSRWGRIAGSMAAAAPAALVRSLRHPAQTASTLAATAGSLARFVRPVTSTRSPVMTERRLRWHFAILDVPVDQLKAAGKAAGGTVNDAFLAGITGGLRRYHEAHDSGVSGLRVTMPISVRSEDDPEGGNRVTLVRFEVPVALVDPVARMRAIGALSADLRRERALPFSEMVAGVLNLLPAAVTGGMLKHVDFLASNVPGFGGTVYLGGARMEAFYPFGPPIGSAANITLMSYRGTCHIGVNTDQGAVPDPDVFLGCLAAGFAEVGAVAPHRAG